MASAQQGLQGTDYAKAIDDAAIKGIPYSEILRLIQNTPVSEKDRELLKGIAAKFTL